VVTLTPLAFAPIAIAQNDPTDLPGAQVLREEARAETLNRGPVTISLGAAGRGILESDFQDNSDASIATYYAQTGATLTWTATDKLSLNFGFGYEAAFYDIDNGIEVFPQLDEDDPFDTLNSISFVISGKYDFTEKWYVLGAATTAAGWEPGADFGEAWTYGGFAGVGYVFSDRFTLALGASATTRLEDDTWVLPFISMRWQATEQLLLETEGAGLRLTATISDQFDVYARGGYEGRSYRLDEDNAAKPNAVLDDNGAFLTVGVAWKPLPGLRVSLEAGALLYRELELRSEHGNELTDQETDIAPIVGIGVRYSF